jgi:hypothetical protein
MCTIKTLGGLLFYPKNDENSVVYFLTSKGMVQVSSSKELSNSMEFKILK